MHEDQQALIKAWHDQRQTARSAGVPEEDLPHLMDVLAGGVHARAFTEAVESLRTARAFSADDLAGLADGVTGLAESGR